MQIGLQIPSFKYPNGPASIGATLKDIAQTAEESGFYSLWVMDHFYQIKGLFGEAYTDPMLEGYSVLNYLAALTENVFLGTLVTGVIYRYPAVLLKTVNTLDILSGGRAYFGVGAAWYEEEAQGYGVPYPTTKERFALLEETIKLTRTVWEAETEAAFQGQYINAPQVVNNPHPLSSPHPRLMIGGMGQNKTMRLVAEYADACNLFEGAGEQKIRETLDALKRHCDDLGRPYDAIEKTSLGTVTLALGKDSVKSIVERCRKLHDLGFSHVIFNMTNVYEITPLKIFGKQIIPAVGEF